MSIKIDRQYLEGFISQSDIDALLPNIEKAHNDLVNKTGKGNDFTGWIDLPSKIEDSFLDELEKLGEEVRSNSDCLVSLGIGGSYLGIRATVNFLGETKLPIEYAGHNIGADSLYNLLKRLKDKDITITVISKSGTTTEPALAFRVIKKFMAEKYGVEEMQKRIICITDKEKGALKQVADKNGYRTFVIPDDVGGRYSVLTPVGLVPFAIAGVDIKALVNGAREGEKEYSEVNVTDNIAYQYAAIRYLLYKSGKAIEVLASFYENMAYVSEWWKQLYGESEAKDGQGIFPASLIMSTDLHSMGQLMQDGVRNIFETFIQIENPTHQIAVPEDSDNLDNFNIVAGKDFDYVNKQAHKATASAHFEGGIPNMTITIDTADAFHLGKLYYLFEKSVGISGYLFGINPFNQPGVEAYKKKMFALLGRK